ncbi:hypothetical protein, partial [Vibrio coralliilyticus]|uniref:hypothetical protein n=1 Tax=Vibrio coralliilyticus TaxID=190893 RepID=UPI0015601458
SGWPLGDVRIEATAQNTNLHVGELTVRSTIVDTASPSVLSVTSSPENPSNGDEVTLTVTFSEPVKGTAGTLDGQTLSFENDHETKETWVGKATISVDMGELEVGYALNSFEDASGNKEGNTDSGQIEVTPSLTITAMNEINSSQVGEVKITGTGQGLESGNVVTVKVISEVDGQTWEKSSPIDAQGDWSVPGESESGVDMSGWPLGDVRIEATAQNTNLHVGELTASSTIVSL